MALRHRQRRRGAYQARRQSALTVPALVAAAFALPGLGLDEAAAAGYAPEEGVVGFKYLYYHDYQPSARRITVHAPAFHVAKTLPNDLVVQGSYVLDSVSGASPRAHSTVSGASKIKDIRRAGDIKLTKYFERMAVGVSLARSEEDDYRSTAIGADLRFFSADRNTTWTIGVGHSGDSVQSVEDPTRRGTRNTRELLLGVTRVVTPNDIVQSNITLGFGRGYYDDPYKSPDVRPDHRNQFAWLARWNHHVPTLDATSRNTFRYYEDSFGVKGVMLATEWDQPLGHGWSIVPGLRYYSQSAADFYYDPGAPPAGARYLSADQRLSAFGALTPGLKVVKTLPDGWIVDFKAEYYEQRAEWKLTGKGSPGLEPFRAQMFQVGVSRRF